jgi:hypothetical protein
MSTSSCRLQYVTAEEMELLIASLNTVLYGIQQVKVLVHCHLQCGRYKVIFLEHFVSATYRSLELKGTHVNKSEKFVFAAARTGMSKMH